MKKKLNVKKKALLIFALVAILLVLHGIMTSSPAMAEHVFSAPQATTELAMEVQDAEMQTVSAGEAIGDGMY